MFSLRPGKNGNINDCPKPRKPTKQVILKLCPKDPYLMDVSCRPNTAIRGMLREVCYTVPCDPCKPCKPCIPCKPCNPCENKQTGFIIELFNGEHVVPVNIDRFCIKTTGYDLELVTILYENVSDHYCSPLGRPVRLLKISMLWKGETRTAEGIVRLAPYLDINGYTYHQIIDTRNLDGSNVSLIPVHTMGVTDDYAYMTSLEGKTVSITYVDYDKETPDRCGIPVTIIDLSIVA